MQNDKYTDFDLELRRMLHDAEEEVPSRVWDAVSGELDRRDRRKVVALRWRRAAAGVAAAAAVLSGIFIFNGRQGATEPDRTAAVVPEVRKADAPQAEPVPDITEQIAASAGALADVPAAPARQSALPAAVPSAVAPAESFTPAESPAPAQEESVVAEPAPREPSIPVQETDKPVGNDQQTKQIPHIQAADPFAWDFDEDDGTKAKEHRTSLSLSGNAMTNDFTGTGLRQMRTPSAAIKSRTGVEEKGTPSYAIPLTFGIGFRFNFSDRWSVGTGLNWTRLSSTFNGIYTEVEGSDIVRSVNSEIEHNIHYLGIPLNLYFNILNNRNLRFYAWGGGEAERGIVNRYRIKSDSGDIFYNESITGIQWSAAAGLGLEYTLFDRVGLFLDPSVHYYFDCGQPSSIRTKRPFMLNYEVGMRFNF